MNMTCPWQAIRRMHLVHYQDMGTWDKMRLDICETLNKMEKPMMGGAVAEGDLHSSILHNVTCEDKEKGGTGLFFSFCQNQGFGVLFGPHIYGSAETSVSEHGDIFIEMLYTFEGNPKHRLILTDLAQSIEITDFENGHSNQTRCKEFLNPSSPMDNNAGGSFVLQFVFKA